MSEELNKEMEQVDEIEESEAKPTGVKAKEPGASNPSSVKLKQEKEDLQKAKTSGKSSDPKATKGAVKPVSVESKEDEEDKESVDEAQAKTESDEEEEKEVKEETPSTPKLKSEIMQGIVDHIKGLKKEDLAKLYGTHVLGETPKEDEGYEEEEEDEEASKIKKEDIDQVVDALDVSGDVEALVDGEELSEDFKTKAATIFEAAVKSKVKSEIERLEGEYSSELSEAKETVKEELTTKVDNYLNYVVEQWMADNELAIEKGIKGEIAEDFIGGLKQLFEDHYIDVPDEKYDVLEAKEKELEEMKAKVNEMTEKSIEDKKLIEGYTKDEIFEQTVEGLADTEKEKIKSLVEDVSFESADAYAKKLSTIKESYFGTAKAPESTENVDTVNQDSNDSNIVSDMSDSMSRYAAAISRGKSRDIYGN